MAPELFQNGIYSTASDFWALGCILYELATGTPPFVHKNFDELVEAILNGTVDAALLTFVEPLKPVEHFSTEFNNLLQGLLEKNPADRLTWSELREHEFWKETVQLPSDQDCKYLKPQFVRRYAVMKIDYWCSAKPVANKPAQANTTTITTNNSPSKNNVMRLSLIVKSNIAKDQNKEGKKCATFTNCRF